MTISIEFWQLLTGLAGILVVGITALFGFGRVLMKQFENNLTERFSIQEESRVSSQRHWDSRFSTLETAAADEAKQWQRVERELLTLKAELPVEYVRRQDYIRNQSVIEAKLDGLAVKIENTFLKGRHSG